MNIFLCASKHNYDKVALVKETLERNGHVVTTPNCYDEPMKKEEVKREGADAHREWKAAMIRLQNEKVQDNDAVLILNFEKNGQANYIGGATFLETYKAFEREKKIFLFNPLPEGIFYDELLAFGPIVIEGDLSLVR